jgi:hypothetical protein
MLRLFYTKGIANFKFFILLQYMKIGGVMFSREKARRRAG